MDNDLTFESTTDSPEQMREGMGLPADAPAPAVESADAIESTEVVGPVSSAPAETAPVVEAAPAETVKPARAKDPVTGKFIATPKPDPIAEERANRMVAETERDALKRRVEELSAGAPKPEPVAPAPLPTIDPETYRDPAITAKFEAQRVAIGPEPQQLDDDDYPLYISKLRAYDRKLAVLEARETDAHIRAGEKAKVEHDTGVATAAKQFDTFLQGKQAARARHADYDTVMATEIPFGGLPYAAQIERAVVEMGAEGAELHYYIAKHPEELTKIQGQPSAFAALTALGRLAAVATAATSAAPAPAGATQTGPATTIVTAPATKPVSRAPEPQGTTLGGGASLTASSPENAKDYQEYKRIREQQIRGRFVR